jgi:hypothetical protein
MRRAQRGRAKAEQMIGARDGMQGAGGGSAQKGDGHALNVDLRPPVRQYIGWMRSIAKCYQSEAISRSST